LLGLALNGILWPCLIFANGADGTEFRHYQDAKGSWLPFAYANHIWRPIFLASGVLGGCGFVLVFMGKNLESRRIRRRLAKRRQKLGQASS
ncbi:MAG: hypothetical protein Q7Q71_13215, partial [Verrucomicrobiota bacterium JB023]|nr:hypothetical protein [Verrucomicrobiota bacterium JB023]